MDAAGYLKGVYRALVPRGEAKVTNKHEEAIQAYLNSGKQPWSPGYLEYRAKSIREALQTQNSEPLVEFPEALGIGLDERIAEYMWIVSRIPETSIRLLDAGSTFNFRYILDHKKFENKELSICTFFPESDCFFSRRISYDYADLRNLPYRDSWFDMVVCQSTLEHIDMDNSIYGYSNNESKETEKKSYEYIKAVQELLRVLKKDGKLLITVPYGKFENHGFFQQFDREMKQAILETLSPFGHCQEHYFLYSTRGWKMSTESETAMSESYNPHTGRGKGSDGAAHCRGILAIEFNKTRDGRE